MVGTRRSPTPKESAAARMKRSRRVQRMYDSTRTPDVITDAKRNVVTPPRTGFGTGVEEVSVMGWEGRGGGGDALERKTPEILPSTP